MKKLPPVEDVSTRIQNLWSICDEASMQTNNELEDHPRFDVCHELKLLFFKYY